MRARVRGDDDGFILLETVIAISLISVVMAAFTTFFVNTVSNTTRQRATQAATQIADSAMETIRGMPASDLLTGHDSVSVAAQFSAASATVQPWLLNMVAGIDPSATAPAPNAGLTAAIPTQPVSQMLGSVTYGVSIYLGTCVVATGLSVNAACGLASALGTGVGFTSYLRAVVAVAWTGTHCPPTLCTYVTSTLLSPVGEPIFNLYQTVPSIPVVTSPGAVSWAVGSPVNQQLTATGTPVITWALTSGALPVGLTLSSTGIITGTPTTIASATISVTATDGFGRPSSPVSFSWSTVLGLTVVAGDSQVVASWIAPASVNGSPVANYTVTRGDAGPTCAVTTTTSCTIAGLTNGTQYSFTVTVTSTTSGTSASPSVAAIPYPAGLLTGPNTTLWLDGNDPTTLTTDATVSPTAITTWKDKSGSGNNVSMPGPTSATAPTIDTTDFPGRTSATFGAGQYLSSSTGFPVNSDYSLFAVYRSTNVSCNGNIVSGVTANGNHAFYTSSGSGLSLYHSGAFAPAGLGAIANTAYVASGTFVSSTLAGSTDVNGSPAAIGTAANQTTDPGIEIGALANAYGFCGQIAEVIVLNRVVTATERRSVESYLARKWAVSLTPDAPPSPTAIPGDGSAVVSWSAPAYNGGQAITGYRVSASPGGASCTTTSALTCSISGLINGTQYTFKVSATNSVGAGPASVASAVTIPFPALMSSGAGMTLWLDGADLTKTFSASTCTGAAAAAAATVGCWGDKSSQSENFTQATAANSPTVSAWGNGLSAVNFADSTDVLNSINANDTYQTVFVVANLAGTPQFAYLFGQSGADFNVRVGSGPVRNAPNYGDWAYNTGSPPLTWTNGVQAAAALSGKIITSDQALSPQTYSANVSSPFMSRGLVGSLGEVIAFRGVLTTSQRRLVENYLSTKWAITVAPDQPTGPTASVADRSTLVTWTAPAFTGGASLTSYTATAFTSQGTAAASCTSTTATSCTIAGLVNGTTYTVTVTATNAIGVGPPSAAVSVTPTTVPGAPTAVLATPGDTTAAVFWSAPASNGSAITAYTATAFNGQGTAVGSCTSTTATSCTITGLTNGTTYTVTVTATNAIGVGPSSAAVSVSPARVPGAPTAVIATPGDTTATVSWTAPASNGGAAITTYTVTASPGSATCTTTGTLTCAVPGLTNGTRYTVTVTASNSAGTSPASAASASIIPFPAGVMSNSAMTLWLDGADPTSTFSASNCSGAAASGTAPVGCWHDKSSQSENFAQVTAANQPTVTTWGNGLNAVNFVDPSRVLNSINATGTYQTVFVVAKLTGAAFDSSGNSASGTAQYAYLFGQAGTDFNVRVGSSVLRNAQNNPNDWAYNTVNTGTPFSWTNGAQAVNSALPATVITSDQAQSAKTFAASLSNSIFKDRALIGSVGEVITFRGVLTTVQRRSMEEYLARKWAVVITSQAPPTVGATVASPTSATVTWTAPTWNGGAPVTGYTATASTGQSCTTTGALSCPVSGLTHGTTYTFTVTATNSVGIGPPSVASSGVTP